MSINNVGRYMRMFEQWTGPRTVRVSRIARARHVNRKAPQADLAFLNPINYLGGAKNQEP